MSIFGRSWGSSAAIIKRRTDIMRSQKRQFSRVFLIGTLMAFTLAIASGFCGNGPSSGRDAEDRLHPYLTVLREQGQEPIRLVLGKLATHDLLIFDDAVHDALEPWEFYQQLVRDKAFQQLAPRIFLECIPINKQRHLDAYLNAASDDPRLLYPAFQDDWNGRGWPVQTYFDFLRTVRTINQTLDCESKLRVMGVCCPTFWSEIQTHEDLVQFHKFGASFDYHMYAAILNEMAQFKEHQKGIFLTNTRHAYKGIRRKDGQFFWNAATFFHQWHPGKTYSIRVHGVSVVPVKAGPMTSPKDFKFVRMAHGLWDSAFHAAGDKPVAFPLQGNVFGQELYIGNDQFDTAPNQKMQDAFDALIFLVPIEKLRASADANQIYTPAFLRELKRRFGLMYTEAQLEEVFERTGTKNLDEFFVRVEKSLTVPLPVRPLDQAKDVGPIDEWKAGLKK
jgi:hypothetical protein